MIDISPDPGPLPSLPSPSPGERVVIDVGGLPPYKDTHSSIRNPNHPKYEAFVRLRCAAIEVMAGRKWYDGPVGLSLTLFAPSLDRSIGEYVRGIEDTLDGSHGMTFTYLPVVFQDDCQVAFVDSRFAESNETRYIVEVVFLNEETSAQSLDHTPAP